MDEQTKRLIANRDKQRALFGMEAMLPDICLHIRMSVNGSADPYETDFLKESEAFLRDKVAIWIPGFDAIDALVLAMVHITIDLIGEELEHRSKSEEVAASNHIQNA